MKLTAKIKLRPTENQTTALLSTLEACNAACNYISQIAWNTRIFSRNKLHKLVYYETRALFKLSAQATVRCIAKVVDAYKSDKDTLRTFKPHGGIAYDLRILRYKPANNTVSIWTIDGRIEISYMTGKQQHEMLETQNGESDLLYSGGKFFLAATCEVQEQPAIDPAGVLGVDLGIINIATDSDGQIFSGSQVNNVRHRHRRLRKNLQKKQTKSAKRRLKKLAGKERRFAADVNHVISKRIVAKAQGTQRAIAVEQLTGIRQRVTVKKSQRTTLHSWSFFQLKSFIQYKAQKAGVPLIEVDPRNTSRTCPACGCVDKRNRPTQSQFSCIACGFAGLADYIASVNISRRAQVNAPNVSIPVAIGSFNRSMAAAGQGQAPDL